MSDTNYKTLWESKNSQRSATISKVCVKKTAKTKIRSAFTHDSETKSDKLKAYTVPVDKESLARSVG